MVPQEACHAMINSKCALQPLVRAKYLPAARCQRYRVNRRAEAHSREARQYALFSLCLHFERAVVVDKLPPPMTPLLAFKAVLKSLLLPPTSLLLAVLFGMYVARRRQVAGRAIACIAATALLLLCVPQVAQVLVLALHPPAPFAVQDARGAGAVVILAGGVRRHAPDYGGDTLSTLTLERVRYGAMVARLTGLPVLVSGGNPQGGEPEALLMRRSLEDEFHLPVTWVESKSDNTRENARLSAPLLRDAHIDRVVLVTHGFDMMRAAAEFEAAGMGVIPAATGLPANGEASLIDWVPSISGMVASHYALYEITGNLVRVIRTLLERAFTLQA